MNSIKNPLVGLYLYATARKKQGVSDNDELYYAALSELEKHGWYDSKSGELKCLDNTEIAFIVDDFVVGFENDFPELRERFDKLLQELPEMNAPEAMFVFIFETLKRMMG